MKFPHNLIQQADDAAALQESILKILTITVNLPDLFNIHIGVDPIDVEYYNLNISNSPLGIQQLIDTRSSDITVYYHTTISFSTQQIHGIPNRYILDMLLDSSSRVPPTVLIAKDYLESTINKLTKHQIQQIYAHNAYICIYYSDKESKIQAKIQNKDLRVDEYI